jgi:hypothetical protein
MSYIKGAIKTGIGVASLSLGAGIAVKSVSKIGKKPKIKEIRKPKKRRGEGEITLNYGDYVDEILM